MEKVAILALVLANFVLHSDAIVQVPFNEESFRSGTDLNVVCNVRNETFEGWFKDDTGAKIPQVASRKDVKDKLAVYVEPKEPGSLTCHLIVPRRSPTTVGGMYTCKGSKTSDKLKLVVKFNVAGLKKNQQLHVNQPGKIELGALSYPLSTITWKKDTKPLDISSDPRLTKEKDGSIMITKVANSDAGTYAANVNWENRNTVDVDIVVTVVDKPEFTVTPNKTKITGVEGYDYEFCFKATGLPMPTLKWFKSTVQFDTTNNRYSVNNDCIGIKKLEKSDIAVYKCVASNNAGTVTAKVEIEKLGVKPSVVPFTQTVYKRNRLDGIQVLCTGLGTPVPTMEWTKDGKVITGQKKQPGKSTLDMSKLLVQQSGNYTCTARNGLIYKHKELTASLDIQLNVIVKPVINEQKSDSIVYSFVGNPKYVRVRCEFYGDPKPIVTMTKDGVSLKNSTQVVDISIRTTDIKEFGNYICKANNIHGDSTYTVKLLRATVPGKPQKLSTNKTCDSITLHWEPPTSDGNMTIIHYIISSLKDSAELHRNNVGGSKRSALIDFKFEPKTTYRIQVGARNAVGAGELAAIDVTTEKFCKPSIPAIYNVPLTVTGDSLIVKWNPPKDNGFDDNLKYKIAWRPKSNPPKPWQVSITLTTTEYQINGLEIGKYEIKVFAISQAGEGHPDMRVVEVKSPEDTTTSMSVISSTATPSTLFLSTTLTPEPELSTQAEMPTLPAHRNQSSKEPPVPAKRTGGLSKGAIAGIVIAILLIVLITIDLFCCFFNSCGVIFCCQRACCGKKYEVDGKESEMEKLEKNPAPEQV